MFADLILVFKGDGFWFEDMIFDWRIWVLVDRFEVDFWGWSLNPL